MGAPGITFNLVAQMDILGLSLFKEVCKTMYKAGVDTMREEGYELVENEVVIDPERHLKVVT